MIDKGKKQLGEKVEQNFKGWLDSKSVPYWYINQNIDTFSKSLKDLFNGKRPDFMILIPGLSFFMVDVKYRTISDYGTFVLDVDEVKKYSSMQRHFNLQTWFVLSDCKHPTWYWIPVPKVLEIGKTNTHTSKKGNEFIAIEPKEFIQIAEGDGLDKLFSKLFTI